METPDKALQNMLEAELSEPPKADLDTSVPNNTSTQFAEKAKQKLQMGLYSNPIEVFADLMDLFNATKHLYEKANEKDRKAFFLFFVLGIVFAHVSIYIALGNMGVVLEPLQYFTLIMSFLISLASGFIMAKFKEIIPLYINPLDQIKNLVNKLSRNFEEKFK